MKEHPHHHSEIGTDDPDLDEMTAWTDQPRRRRRMRTQMS
jgi:hypothetical protein